MVNNGEGVIYTNSFANIWPHQHVQAHKHSVNSSRYLQSSEKQLRYHGPKSHIVLDKFKLLFVSLWPKISVGFACFRLKCCMWLSRSSRMICGLRLFLNSSGPWRTRQLNIFFNRKQYVEFHPRQLVFLYIIINIICHRQHKYVARCRKNASYIFFIVLKMSILTTGINFAFCYAKHTTMSPIHISGTCWNNVMQFWNI